MERREFLERLTALFAAAAVAPGCGWGSARERTQAAAVSEGAAPSSASTFHAVYDDVRQRDAFFQFLQNVFHLYPEDDFHQLIVDLTAAHAEDQAIYEALLADLPGIAPVGSQLTYALPALKKQKRVMAEQAAAFLADVERVDGYVEVGSKGRYIGSLSDRVPVEGPVFLLHEEAPGFGPVDMLERGQVRKVGTFVPMGNYDPVASSAIPDASIGVVSNLIGFHHCPEERLEGFVQGLRRVLRPGGRLLLREHDVVDPTMDHMVTLAHDVFNAGVGLTWGDNERQVRGFRSVADWTALLEGWGFKRSEAVRFQEHDPTKNAMLQFVKV